MKECSSCGDTKELAQFPRSRNTADGYTETCKSCKDGFQTSGERQLRAQQQNRHFQKKRSELYRVLGGKCACQGCEACGDGPCGSKGPPLHLDHRDWRLKRTEILQRQLSFSHPEMQAEIKLIQLLCSPCHNVKTTQDRTEQRAEKEVLRQRNRDSEWLTHEAKKRGRKI